MNMLIYLFVFLASLAVDIIPLIGPPAWMVMVFFQLRFGLNIWIVLITRVIGSAAGRYLYSGYIHLLSKRFIKPEKHEDLQFIGGKLANNSWRVQLFVFIYTLLPLPSTPLFTAAGSSGINTLRLIPAFIAGKFISDAVMVFTGDYVANNVNGIIHGLLTWKAMGGILLGLLLICLFLFTDWRQLLQKKKFRIHFNIWKF